MHNILAIIPARGGSKGVPRKNIRLLAGLPLIVHTILAARGSGGISRLILTTDSAEIADIARQYGVEVPFMRPAELAQDDTPGLLPLLHAVRWVMEHENYFPDYILELVPTSPLRTTADIDAAISLIIEKNADSVVSLTPAGQHPCWAKRVDEHGKIKPFIATGLAERRRQDLPPAYALHGAIKIARREMLLERASWYTDNTCAYVMPQERSLEIDTEWDFKLAGWVLREASGKK